MHSAVEVKAADPEPFIYGVLHGTCLPSQEEYVLTSNGSLEKSFHVNALIVRRVTGMKHS